MEKDFGSWFHYQHSEKQSPNLNFLSDPLNVGRQSSLPAFMNPYSNEVSINGTFPSFPFSGLPQYKASQLNEPLNWFYCLPRLRQAFVPSLNTVQKEKFPLGQTEIRGRTESPDGGTGCAQKRFLVFDQSGNQTTLVYSSGLGAHLQCPTSFNPKPPAAYGLTKEEVGIKREMISQVSPFLSDEHNEENHGDDVDSEMHEDTEELNALLYSDDENDYSDDDDVTSTGHSPSTMTEHGIKGWFEESDEEVASCSGPTKRRKLLAGGYDAQSLMVAAASADKPDKFCKIGDDAESSSAKFDNQASDESVSLSGKKRSRKEKIRQTVNILQSIIPGGKAKDAMVVIDEAIHYLKSLKVKAKSLGLDAL